MADLFIFLSIEEVVPITDMSLLRIFDIYLFFIGTTRMGQDYVMGSFDNFLNRTS